MQPLTHAPSLPLTAKVIAHPMPRDDPLTTATGFLHTQHACGMGIHSLLQHSEVCSCAIWLITCGGLTDQPGAAHHGPLEITLEIRVQRRWGLLDCVSAGDEGAC